jgi:hypothetical protein
MALVGFEERLSCAAPPGQVRAPPGHCALMQLRLTAVQVSRTSRGEEQRPGRRLVAKVRA